MKKALTLLACLVISSNASAGWQKLTIHSRANCINNESISWDRKHNWILNTESYHFYHDQFVHQVVTGWQYTWRSAAVDFGEGYVGIGGGWAVHGIHHIAYRAGQDILLGDEWVVDCSIYNGWWDK